MAVDALKRLEQTVLFQTLCAREDETGAGHEISERVKSVVEHVAPLLERVADKMPEFTLHDPNHGAKVVELMAQFLPAETLKALNVVELSTLIYSAYLHDLGMTCSADEREEIIKSDAEFARLLAGDEARSLRLQQLKDEGDHRAATAVEDQVFTEYLRRTHVRRSARFIEESLAEGERAISWQGTPYYKWVRAVCDSHALPVNKLRDTKTWPRDALVRDLRVNVQYLSLVLRLADILDLDPERTPKVLLDFINPKDPTSVREWRKHRSVIGWEITPERIRFEAECTHPVYERALREFLDWIEIERQDSVLLATSYRDELSRTYRFDLSEPVTKERVRSNGTYIYSDLKFNIDYQRVLNLLMGERLYGNSVIALRELLQNSVDAVRFREALEEKAGAAYTPHIAVRLEGDRLVVEDNGVGMDEHIVKNYFMQVGRSYYRSPEFRASQIDIDPISEFGIGILSVFMVADRCEVESRRWPVDPLHPPAPIKIEIPTAYDFFVQRPSDFTRIGTTITLFLKPDHPFKPDNLLRVVSRIAPFIEYPITIQTTEGITVYHPRQAGDPILGGDVDRVIHISLEDSDDPVLAGSKGNLYLVRGYAGSALTRGESTAGILAQRGFAIGNMGTDLLNSEEQMFNTGDLFPRWTKAEVSVDLRGESKLLLTPDRGSVVKDERFKSLQSAIEKRIIHAFRKHLENQRNSLSPDKYESYVNGLLEDRLLSPYAGVLSEGLKELFLDLVPLPYISPDDKILRCFGRELENIETFAKVSDEDLPVNVSLKQLHDAVKSEIHSTVVILYPADSGDDMRYGFIGGIYGEETGVLITSIPGIVVSLTAKNPNTPRDMYLSGMILTRGMLSSKNSRPPVIAHSLSPTDLDGPIFNALHPLLAPYLTKRHLKKWEDDTALRTLATRVGSIFYELADGPTLMLKKSTDKYVDRYEYPNVVLVGVLHREPALLDSLRSAFADFWREGQEAGMIDAEMPFPGLMAEDLPWFWSHDG